MSDAVKAVVVSKAARKSGVRLAIAGSASGRAFFGPFLPGEAVHSITLSFCTTAALPVVADFVSVDVRSFSTTPTDSSAAFAADGRALYDPANLPYVHDTHMPCRLPVNFVASQHECYLGVQVTEKGTHNIDGSVFIELGSPDGMLVQ